MTSTCDIHDEHRERAIVCELQLRQFGGVRAFTGEIATVQCLEDNVLIKQQLTEPGNGRVLVVDAGGSMRCALVGDNIAGLGVENGWAGIVINGCVRDMDALAGLPIGIKALGTCPRPSGKDGFGKLGVPVVFGAATFRPGATLWSDDDGIVALDPAESRPA
jgi:regulator of ribonuclease activity A